MCNCISQIEDKVRQQFTSTHEEIPMYVGFEMAVRVDYGKPRWYTQRVKRGHVNYPVKAIYCPFCGEVK